MNKPAKKILLYSTPGIGKTYMLSTLRLDSRTSPVLWLDFEGGFSTFEKHANFIESLKDLDKAKSDKVNVIFPKTMADVINIVNWMTEHPKHYKSIVVDSVTYMLKNWLEESRVAFKIKRKEMTDIPDRADYQNVSGKIWKVIDALGENPFVDSVWFTAWEGKDTDERGTITSIRPELSPSLRVAVTHAATYVLRMYAEGENRKVRTRMIGNVQAKSMVSFDVPTVIDISNDPKRELCVVKPLLDKVVFVQ